MFCFSFLAPIHGGWGPWSPDNWLDPPCHNRIKTRRRECNKPSPAHGGSYCSTAIVGEIKQMKCSPCETNNGGCDHICIDMGHSHRCECYRGFKLYSATGCKRK